jgi:hypothetical protein
MPTTNSLFQEVGLAPTKEERAARQAQAGAGGTLLRGAAGAIGSLFGKNKDLTLREGFAAGAQRESDAYTAQFTGQSVEQVRTRRKVRQEAAELDAETTGDALKDQQAHLDSIIKIANKYGDAEVITNALRRKVALEAQEADLRSLELGSDAQERDNRIQAETDSTGRTVILQGDDPDGRHSKAQRIEGDPQGRWRVIRPDGSEEIVDPLEITFVDTDKQRAQRAAQRERQFETPEGQMKTAFQSNGLTGQQPKKVREFVAAMGEQGIIIESMTNSLLNMYDPDLAFDLSGKTLVGVDAIVTYAGNVSEVFAKAGDRDQEKWAVTWQGKKTTAAEQAKRATSTSIFDEWLAEQGSDLTQVLPPHIKHDSREAQLFLANVMQMAYLDARIQEPSNRGLSDTDIKNALTRIGVNTANPRVFAERQMQNINRMRGNVANLGIELSGTADIPKGVPGGDNMTVRGRLYQREFIDKINGHLDAAASRLEILLSEPAAGPAAAPADKPLSEYTPEELDALEAELSKGT